MTRDQKLALIYRHEHKDYKGKAGADKTIFRWAKFGGGIIALTEMTDTEIAERLPRALRKETERQAKNKV